MKKVFKIPFPFKITLWLLTGIIITLPVHTYSVPLYDSTQIQWRKFDENMIEKYRKDSSFYYEREKTEASNWLEELINWLRNLFKINDPNIEPGTINNSILNFIYLLIILIAVGLIVYALTQAKFRGFLSGKGAKVKVDYEVIEEDIHEIKYESELQIAEKNKDFRKAVRLHYLEVLKLLNERNWIEWKLNKTNHEYDKELKNTKLLVDFQKVTLIFDYVWYGDFNLTEEKYTDFSNAFNSYKQVIFIIGSNPLLVSPKSPNPELK